MSRRNQSACCSRCFIFSSIAAWRGERARAADHDAPVLALGVRVDRVDRERHRRLPGAR